jgi:NAD-dependent dihydropyrimidine dehydrogenase PreA subunit
MCEFCTEHGEGKKWYLEMKNYSEILLHEELTPKQKEVTGVNSRLEYLERDFLGIMSWALGKDQASTDGGDETTDADLTNKVEISDNEHVARQKIAHFGQVVPIEDVDAIVDMVSSITLYPCGCRYISTGKVDNRYCIGLGFDKTGLFGKYPEESASLEVLGKDEAKKILHKFDEEGLMHSIWTGITPYVEVICNCDRDCRAYNGSYVEKRAPSFFRGEYICQVDWDQCTGCKECISQCQFGALHYSSTLSKVYIHPAMCFGCGVCRAACSNVAISLLPRAEHEIAQHYWLAREL